MGWVTVRPNSTISGSGFSLAGAASHHAALADDSDGSYSYAATPAAGYPFASLTLGFPAPTLPDGAVWKKGRVRVRSNISWTGLQDWVEMVSTLIGSGLSNYRITWNGVTVVEHSPHITWPAIPTNQIYIALSGNQIDTSDTTYIYAVYIDVYAVAKPVVDVIAPTGTLSEGNLPTVEWNNTLDGEGGAQASFRVKVFNDAQYGAGGFDPEEDTPVVDSGLIDSSAETWQIDSDEFVNDTYRSYVKVAQLVNGVRHWSDWAYEGFVLDADTPGIPTLEASAINSAGAILLVPTATSGTVTTDEFELQRSDDGGVTWTEVRTTLGEGIVDAP